MKKILTVALVAMLTAASLFAGVSFSGRFRQGYVLNVADGAATVNEWKTEEAKLVMKFADDNGAWTINFQQPGTDFDTNDKWAANATVDVKKALAAAGVDTGDFGLKVSLGHNSKMTALSVYNDVTGNGYYKLKNNGSTSFQLAASYKMVKLNVAVDPSNKVANSKDKKFTEDSKRSAVVSAQITPVDGVSVTAAYALNGWIKDGFGKDQADDKELYAQHIVGGAVNVDIAKLASLDFALSFSAYDNFALSNLERYYKAEGAEVKDYHAFADKDTKYNSFAANIKAGYGKVSGYVEFVMGMELAASSKTTMGLNASLAYAITDDFSVDAYAYIGNFSKVSDSLTIGADLDYTLAGVELALNGEYAVGDKAFTLTPYMVIVF